MMADFEPRIIAFLCNWCSYAGADLAGISRQQYPPNIRIIRVMCSGRLDPRLIFKSFAAGADGVLVTGCHPGDCHYISGNKHTQVRLDAINMVLAKTGLESNRLRLEWVSASEGERFAKVVTEFVEGIRDAGPLSASGTNPELIRAAEITFMSPRLRVLLGREVDMTENQNAYGEQLDRDAYNELVEESLDQEFERARIMDHLNSEPSSVIALSSKTGIPAERVLRHITQLRRKGFVGLDRLEERTPYYGLAGGVLLE